MALHLILNGREREVVELSAGASLTELVRILEFRPDRIAVERNGEIVPRATWPSELLADGDRLEIVNFVGGGSAARPHRI